jgi:predicted DNA binding protein
VVVIATFTVERGLFPFDRLFETRPDAVIELERIVPVGDVTVPYFWITGGHDLDFQRLVAPHEAVVGLTLVTESADQALVRITWASERDALFDALDEADVTLVSAVGTAEGWSLELRAEERSAISRFHALCTAAVVPVTLVELHTLTPNRRPDSVDLTDPQTDALVLAYERGYYDEPRQVTLTDLATELGISRQAVSTRLKRGIKRLVEQTLTR